MLIVGDSSGPMLTGHEVKLARLEHSQKTKD
jgi:hypothetical protein